MIGYRRFGSAARARTGQVYLSGGRRLCCRRPCAAPLSRLSRAVWLLACLRAFLALWDSFFSVCLVALSWLHCFLLLALFGNVANLLHSQSSFLWLPPTPTTPPVYFFITIVTDLSNVFSLPPPHLSFSLLPPPPPLSLSSSSSLSLLL